MIPHEFRAGKGESAAREELVMGRFKRYLVYALVAAGVLYILVVGITLWYHMVAAERR